MCNVTVKKGGKKMRGRSEKTSVRATNMAWGTPFPPSRMPASIENSIKLFVCLELVIDIHDPFLLFYLL